MAAKGYWSSPCGKTPEATLYSGMIKEITTKRKEAGRAASRCEFDTTAANVIRCFETTSGLEHYGYGAIR